MSILCHLRVSIFLLLLVMISGCSIPKNQASTPADPTDTLTLTEVPPSPDPPTDTPTQTSTFTPTITSTPEWIYQSGTITCPILLYHRIGEPPVPNSLAARYYITPADFEWQMQALNDWGYSTIPISLLIEAIISGAPLPPRSVVISFDDGYESVYEGAYPIMKAHGFTGVLYLIATAVGSQDYMNAAQIQEMIGKGWEIGSHSMTHPHLPAVHDQISYEGGYSKDRLASEMGISISAVETFAYPYGESDTFVFKKIAEYGYLAAVGLGTQYVHSLQSLYYLSRIEVRNGTDPAVFATLLPWSGQP